METRANHVLIGTFTVAVLLGALGFALWLAKIEIDRRFALYDVFFEGSVAGLSVAGDVRYQGVRVGQVKEIAIDDSDTSRVRVRIEVDANTPVSTDSSASLEFFGVTGVLYVQISGGSPDAPPLRPGPGQEVAVIAAQKSSIEELFAGAPRLLENGVVLVERLSQLVNRENRQTISDILANFETISGSIANRGDEIEGLLANAHTMSGELTEVAKNLNALSGRLDGLAMQADTMMQNDVHVFLQEATHSARSIGALAGELDMVVKDNKVSINTFTDKGLREFATFVVEARQLVVTLERVAQRMESDPARFFLGTSASEYRPE